jgi:hypothetical protein
MQKDKIPVITLTSRAVTSSQRQQSYCQLKKQHRLKTGNYSTAVVVL